VAWNGKKDATRTMIGPRDLIPDVEVVMREAALLVCQDAVVGVLGGILRQTDPKCPALFHALEYEVDAIGILLQQAVQRRQDVLVFANIFLRPFNRDLVVAGVSLHPALVIFGALTEHLLAHHRNAQDFVDEVNHLLRPGEPI
jgi:hypothetical protein